MYLKWIGLLLILSSLATIGVAVAGISIYQPHDDFARVNAPGLELQDGTPVMDRSFKVPGYNDSVGWVGFNVSLLHQGAPAYHATGILLPNSTNQIPRPDVVMAAVNESAFSILMFNHFDDDTWKITQVYAWASLNDTEISSTFQFERLDNQNKYILLFRGRINVTTPMPILISIKESWSDQARLIQLDTYSGSVTISIAVLGSILFVYDLQSNRQKKTIRHKRIRQTLSEKKRIRT